MRALPNMSRRTEKFLAEGTEMTAAFNLLDIAATHQIQTLVTPLKSIDRAEFNR